MNDEEKEAVEIVNSLKEWGKIHFIVKDRCHAKLTYNEVYLLLALIEKLQKGNEELKFEERRRIIGKYGDVEIHDVINRTLSNDYISKQKIKDKIEELSKTKGDLATHIAVSERIRALQELLEESEDSKDGEG